MKKTKNSHFKFNLLYLIFFIYVFQSPTKKIPNYSCLHRISRVCNVAFIFLISCKISDLCGSMKILSYWKYISQLSICASITHWTF